MKEESPLQVSLPEREDLIANLKELVIRTLRLEDVSLEDIVATEPLFGDGLGLDSIDALELVVGIEREYQVEIPDAEVGRQAFASISALADFIMEKGAGQKASDAVG
jgi:acyl carrier protein